MILALFTGPLQAAPQSWIVDSQADWTQTEASSTNISLADGFAEPTSDTASFQSTIKTYAQKRKARYITFAQSPVWDNWTQITDISPTGSRNAPVFVSVADNDYWYLAELRNAGHGYHAWHSTDMINWTHHGIISDTDSKWVTSAEYVPDPPVSSKEKQLLSSNALSIKVSSATKPTTGKFYITYDKPNDEDPHLLIDSDLTDGLIGQDMGMVLSDPSYGSDNALFRDDDGSFHIIYEDWSPINARNHSWDSPLAGHADSPDCINGFGPHEYPYPIDERSTPTGTFGTYIHGTTKDVYTYEIHDGPQHAYGDYTMIKVGSQYHLFCDFDAHDRSMRVGRWTSGNIYQPFTWSGEIGQGLHPDPTIGFAEGQFYLIVQTDEFDFASPGPWVDNVQARAGVDTDGDSTIDQWTTWQTITEQYSHKPGFARIVNVAPARIDLSSLPAGFGFKFEFNTTDTTTNDSKPIMDSVTMSFN